MPSEPRSRWPALLLLGLVASLGAGTAAAVAAPSDEGRPAWHDGRLQRITGTALDVDRGSGTLVLDGLVSYDPVRAGIGTLVVHVADLGAVAAGDTLDVEIVRRDGGWYAERLELLDPD